MSGSWEQIKQLDPLYLERIRDLSSPSAKLHKIVERMNVVGFARNVNHLLYPLIPSNLHGYPLGCNKNLELDMK
jgi:hypothetical protein